MSCRQSANGKLFVVNSPIAIHLWVGGHREFRLYSASDCLSAALVSLPLLICPLPGCLGREYLHICIFGLSLCAAQGLLDNVQDQACILILAHMYKLYRLHACASRPFKFSLSIEPPNHS